PRGNHHTHTHKYTTGRDRSATLSHEQIKQREWDCRRWWSHQGITVTTPLTPTLSSGRSPRCYGGRVDWGCVPLLPMTWQPLVLSIDMLIRERDQGRSLPR